MLNHLFNDQKAVNYPQYISAQVLKVMRANYKIYDQVVATFSDRNGSEFWQMRNESLEKVCLSDLL